MEKKEAFVRIELGLVLSFLLCLSVLMVLSGCDLQNKILYYPTADLPSEKILSAMQLRYWPLPGADYRGLVSDREADCSNGTMVLFHGNASTASDCKFYIDALGSLGYRVILAEYPMYGGRGGGLGEKPFVTDAVETLELAYETYGRPIYVVGQSLGCGVAAAAVKNSSVEIDGILLLTPWDSLKAVVKSKYPLLPFWLFLTDKYDSIRNLESFGGRIAIVGAEKDEVLPIRHADRFFKSLPGTAKKWWTIKGAGHNNWPGYVTIDWWKEIAEFMSSGDLGKSSNLDLRL
jgi:pimeloyl-ACP methyl ester carboxylesterase